MLAQGKSPPCSLSGPPSEYPSGQGPCLPQARDWGPGWAQACRAQACMALGGWTSSRNASLAFCSCTV